MRRQHSRYRSRQQWKDETGIGMFEVIYLTKAQTNHLSIVGLCGAGLGFVLLTGNSHLISLAAIACGITLMECFFVK